MDGKHSWPSFIQSNLMSSQLFKFRAHRLDAIEMLPVLWILLVLFMGLGKCEKYHPNIRHQRTRYLSLGSSFFTGNQSGNHRPSEFNAKSSRPLFSWDPPTEELTAVSPVNHHTNISAIKPTIWHGRRKSLKRTKAVEQSRSRSKSISFRKSYVYKAIPTEEGKITPSKKIIYVVSGKSEKPKRRKGVRRCKNPKKCGSVKGAFKHGKWWKRRYQIIDDNETHMPKDVDYFPKGLIAEGIEELRHSWNNRQDESLRNNTKEDRGERRNSLGLCSNEGCEQICTEKNGRAVCSCHSGFLLVNVTKCIDINECQVDNGGCEGTCINTIGSRRCLCPRGFRLSPADDKCEDINECLLRNGHGPCQDTCINTNGGYYCTCDGLKGTILSEDNHTCEEINECNSGAAGCSHSCISTFGRAFCTCPDGYELGDDWKTCHDIDECSDFQDHCELGCVNTIGSYYCEIGNAI